MTKQQYALVPVAQITIAKNVRREVGDVSELAESIVQHGLLEPIVACPSASGKRVELLMGQRRLAAARAAGLTEVPCLLRGRPSERDRLLMQLAENLDRKNMTPIDEALAFAELAKIGLSQEEIGRCVRVSQYLVSTRMQLLRMPEVVQEAIHRGDISARVALAVPRGLWDDTRAVRRLEKVIGGGDDAVRKWMREEVKNRSAGKPLAQKYQEVRHVDLSLETFEIAHGSAKALGLSVPQYIKKLVVDAAKKKR